MSQLSTKLSISAALLILALGVSLGSRQQSEIAQLQQQAESEVSQSNHSSSSRRRTVSTAKKTTSETIAKLLELEPYSKKDPEIDRRELDTYFKIEIASLSSSQAEKIARTILNSKNELNKAEIRLFRYSLVALADEHPQTTLEFINTALETSAFSNISQFRASAIPALTNLGKENLGAVIKWFASEPEIARTEQNKVLREIFKKRAPRNYSEALSLIENEIPNSMAQTWAMYGLHDSLTWDQIDDFLFSIRKSTASPNLKREALEVLGIRSLGKDVKTITEWIAENNFTYEEIRGVLNGLKRRGAGSQTEWINWIAKDSLSRNRFSGAYQSAVRNLLTDLIHKDFVKAGQLINSLPHGSKIQEFAKTKYTYHISNLDLEAAIEWFDTLPPSTEKTKTGRDLYHKLFHTKPDLAEEFAIKNQLYVD